MAMDAKGFGDDFRYRHTRIKGRERILEHGLHPPAKRPETGVGSAADDFFAGEGDGSRRGRDEAQNHPGHSAFAGARFAYQSQGLSAGKGEGDSVNDALFLACAAPPAAPRVVLGELVYLEQSHGHRLETWMPEI
jgi:hypothetical protein